MKIDLNEPTETECGITTEKSVAKSKKPKKTAKKEPKVKKTTKKTNMQMADAIPIEDKIDELAGLERKSLAKLELDREIENQKLRIAKQAGSSATNAIRAEQKRKSELFHLYLSGELTRDQVLLAGFVPQERKIVRKDPNYETIAELRRRLFEF